MRFQPRSTVKCARSYSMDQAAELERARALAREAIALCESIGHHLAASHLQHALDVMHDSTDDPVRERPTPAASY